MKIFIIVLVAVILAILMFLSYIGMFSKVSISERKMGPYTYAFVTHVGPYTEVGKPMMELNDKMTEAGFNSIDGIGIYYDDPKQTSKEKLRSDVGSIISTEDLAKVESNKDNFDFATLEESNYIVAEFPIKNPLSYMFGPMKVYPAFTKYLEEKNIEVPTIGIELYDVTNKKILYMMEK
jgi:DNA gyrase inhibitor GyrI